MGKTVKNILDKTERLFAASWLLCSGLILSVGAAEIDISQSDTENSQSQELEIPDLEFLEFLGQFESDNGEWIEPESLLGEGLQELLDTSLDDENNSNATQNGND